MQEDPVPYEVVSYWGVLPSVQKWNRHECKKINVCVNHTTELRQPHVGNKLPQHTNAQIVAHWHHHCLSQAHRWIAFSRFDNKPLGASCLVNLVIVEGQPQSCNLIPPPITSRCWQFNHLHVVKVIFDEFGDGHVKFFAEGIGFEQVA